MIFYVFTQYGIQCNMKSFHVEHEHILCHDYAGCTYTSTYYLMMTHYAHTLDAICIDYLSRT